MSYIGSPPISAAFITDQFSGTGTQTTFTMSIAPATTASILVSVSGVLQGPSTYSVNGTTLTFSQAPPADTANVSVRYLGIPVQGVVSTAYRTVTEFTATDGQSTYTVPSYTVGYINVYRNGVRLGAADYTASNGTTVVLTAAAIAGDLVTTESFYVSSVLNAIPATAGAVSNAYIADGNVTQAKLATNVAGNGPAFSAYPSGTQSITSGVYTKVACNTEEFDTNGNFDKDTNYRFLPTVAGYYQVNAAVGTNGTSTNSCVAAIYKNGSVFKYGAYMQTLNANSTVAALVYLNGSTDYLELYTYVTASVASVGNGASSTYFQAAMVRAA